MKNNVLIIDCDLATCKEIKYNLSSDTIAAYYALSITEGLAALSKKRYEAVVLDSSFPEMDGMEILGYLRQMDNMPILVMSATPSSEHKAETIAAGADTYIKKPLDIEDCLLEVYALLRRYTELNTNGKRCYSLVSCGDIVLDRNMRSAFCHNTALPLSRRDYELLSALICNSQQVLTFERIHELLWDEEFYDDLDSRNRVRCQIKRLRKKLPKGFIETIRDVGFRIKKK